MKTLLLAAGSGVNLSPLTDTRPKPMLHVGGSPILKKTFHMLKKAGVIDITMIVGHKREKITDYFGNGEEADVNIHYVKQDKLTGIGDAIMLAKDKFIPGEYFMLVYGDIVTSSNIFRKTLQSFNSFRSPVASICLPPSTKMYGNVFLDSKMSITKIIEKPEEGNMGNYVLAGIFILPTSFFKVLSNNNCSMEKALQCLAKEGSLKASIWEDEWIDIIYPWDILNANKMIMDSWDRTIISKSVKMEGNVTLNGIVTIEQDVIIKAGAVIDGPCFIGKGSYIGNNSLIRQYSSLGQKSVVGYGVELKNCITFGNSKIGRLSFIGDSIVGEDVDIGAGSVTINRPMGRGNVLVPINGTPIDSHLKKLGSFIGDNVTIGATNSFPSGSLIESGACISHNTSFNNSGLKNEK